MAESCPVIGATTTVLPPDHPQIDNANNEKRCPVTNAKVEHHNNIIHSHPSAPTIPDDKKDAMDASQCPVAKQMSNDGSIAHANCPVVGPVSALLPPAHPKLSKEESGTVCPVTNATLEHHEGKVAMHPAVPDGSPVQQCPVAKNMLQ